MNLVIVESPTKAQTIKKFLGKGYETISSYGHIRDLPKSELGVDVEKNFEPKYVIPAKARGRVKELKNKVKKSEKIILATDEDREGEAIAWHLTKILNLNGKPYQRITFHEITKQAIMEALKNPRKIDLNLVDAQQARRILDRLVGYKLSPFLWKKVMKGLSAGRVQSVAVRLVVEREREIKNFVPQEYWTIESKLKSKQDKKNKSFLAQLTKKGGEIIPKLGIKTKKETDRILKDLKGAEYKVENIEKKEVKKNPLPPFTTSTLQQTAWQRFRWPAKFTMRIAQQLYEKGLCTYHRTDCLNLSDFSTSAAKEFIIKSYGENYWPGYTRKYKTKSKGAQEAHEAIRPTYPNNTSEKISEKLDKNQLKLYSLIWQRFIACQMAQAIFDSTRVDISVTPKGSPAGQKKYTFKTTGQTLKFEGFLKVYPLKFSKNELPQLEKDEILKLIKIIPSQHFTQPPPRYTEATLIKTLEKNGIGRPSTYAPILSTIQERNYVEKNEQKRFFPTKIGTIVDDVLVKHFPEIVDIGFTAKMEKELDEIAEGKDTLVKTCQDFYKPFAKNLKEKYEEVEKKDLTEKTNKKCPKCGSPLVIRLGRFGRFYACSSFPKCKYTEPLEKKTLGIKCPKCKKGEIVEKKTKNKKIFYGCNRFPKCDFALWDKPTGEKCSKCGSLMVEKYGGVKCSNKDCDYKR